MKNSVIWIVACLIGAATGFLTAYFFDFNYYLWSGLGVIVGSSAGIAFNVNRSGEKDHFHEEIEADHHEEINMNRSKKVKSD